MKNQLTKETNQANDISPQKMQVLQSVIFPGAKDPMVIVLAEKYCKERGLDIMKRPVAIVPMWNSKTKKYEEHIWPTISEQRTTAARTGLYAGIDSPVLGPIIEEKFVSTYEDDRGGSYTKEIKVAYPEWCEVTIYRLVQGERYPFTERVYWKELVSTDKNKVPNSTWQKRPIGQLIKCAEAAALRAAFPEEVGQVYTAEEMDGQEIIRDVTPEPVKKKDAVIEKILASKSVEKEEVKEEVKQEEIKKENPKQEFEMPFAPSEDKPLKKEAIEAEYENLPLGYEVIDGSEATHNFNSLNDAFKFLKGEIMLAEGIAKQDVLSKNSHIQKALKDKGEVARAEYLETLTMAGNE